MATNRNRAKATIVGAVGAGLSGLWRAYSAVATAQQVPEDLRGVSALLAEPGFWPWLFLAGFLVLLGWSLWPRADEPETPLQPAPSGPQTTHAPHSQIFRDVHGNVTINPPPAASQEPKSLYRSARSPWDDPSFSLLNPLRGLKPRPSGRRDTPIAEGIVYVATRRWGGSFGSEASKNMGSLGSALQEVRQAAADDDVRIWGKPSRNSVHVEIPPSFWVGHQPNWFSLIDGETTTDRTEFGASYEEYFDLMVSRIEFQRTWPAPFRGGEDDDKGPGDNWKTV